MSKKTVVPNEVWLDSRLSDRQRRVLGALYSFKGKGDEVWPTRGKIAERCGLDIEAVSKATSALVRLGWLTKTGAGGKSMAVRYRLHVPACLVQAAQTVAEDATVTPVQTVAEDATVTPVQTVAEDATVTPVQTVAECATQTVAEHATGKELTNELTTAAPEGAAAACAPAPAPACMREPEFALQPAEPHGKPITQRQARVRGAFVTAKKPDCVSQQTWDDFCTLRKHMKRPAAVTEKSIAVSYREAEKAGISIEQALTYAIEFNWQNYNAEWHKRRMARQMADAQPRDTRTFKQRDMDDTRARFAVIEGRADVSPSRGFAQPPRFDGVTVDVVARESSAQRLPS